MAGGFPDAVGVWFWGCLRGWGGFDAGCVFGRSAGTGGGCGCGKLLPSGGGPGIGGSVASAARRSPTGPHAGLGGAAAARRGSALLGDRGPARPGYVVARQPDLTLAEIRDGLAKKRGLSVATGTARFDRDRIRRKNSAHAAEQDSPDLLSQCRAWFANWTAPEPDRLVFGDGRVPAPPVRAQRPMEPRPPWPGPRTGPARPAPALPQSRTGTGRPPLPRRPAPPRHGRPQRGDGPSNGRACQAQPRAGADPRAQAGGAEGNA